MLANLSHADWALIAVLGLTLARKLTSVAAWAAATMTPDDARDDHAVARLAAFLDQVEALFEYVPTLKMKLPGKAAAPALLLAGALSTQACGASLQNAETTVVPKVEAARDIASEICLLAHAFNARLNVDPQLTITKGKIDSVCDPALEALQIATSDDAKAVLAKLRTDVAAILR
jgi:hypothetical protein